jgi:hypothetical protein
MTLKFEEWERLNEANLLGKITKWFSDNFGGKMSKLDSLIDEYSDAETSYVDEWEKIQEEIDKLELEKEQTKSDPAELKRINKFIRRNEDALSAGEKSHMKNIDFIMSKVKKEISNDSELRKYWELNKTRVDSEIAEDMYTRAKKLADPSISKTLYRLYKDTVLKAKEKDEEFRKEYGNLISGSAKDKKIDPESYDNEAKLTDAEMGQYVGMNLTDFTRAVRNLDKSSSRELAGYLIKKRNDIYIQMNLEKDELDDQIIKKTGHGENREKAKARLREINAKYMGKIRELRSKISVIRR